jgi:hypothetical protein
MRDQEFLNLIEAYSSIYEKKHEPEMEEGEMEKGESEKDEGGKHKEGKHPKGKEEKGEKVTEKEGKETEKEMKEGVSYSAKKARAGKDIGKPGKMFGKIAKEAGERYGSEERGKKVAGAVLAKLRKEEFEGDLFDCILEHLVAEGYADTNKAALAIMANMSEEWKQSIVEQSAMAQRTAAVVDDQRRGSYGMADDLNKTRKSLDKLKPYPNGFPNASGVKGV